MNSDEEKLKALFESEDKSPFKNIVRKAKVLSIVKNIIISLMMFVIVSFVVLMLNATVLNNMSSLKQQKLRAFYDIAMPNAYVGTIQVDDRVMVGQIDYNQYRFLGKKPIPDGNYKEEYTYVPLINGLYGDNSNYINVSLSDDIRKYSKFGKLVMNFYHPDVKYEGYTNDLTKLDEIGKDKLMEMSLSFDKAYSIDEVRAMLPKDITLNWYWVDTFSKDEILKISRKDDIAKSDKKDASDKLDLNHGIFDEYSVYGIKALDEKGNVKKQPELEFIDTIMRVKGNEKYPSIYNELFSKLSNGKSELSDGKAGSEKENLRIIGVVVSGDTQSLKSLKDKSYINGATLGAVADKY